MAASRGLFYPPEPASAHFSTIGGNVAESAGGLGCVKYGLTKHFIAGLEFVTAGGEIVRTGVYADSDSPFDPGAVLLGSEGTLGIITEVAVRLIPLPTHRATVLALFRSLPETASASNAVLRSGVNPAVLEFMDRSCIDTVREYADVEIPDETGALLIVELDGAEDEVRLGHESVLDILSDAAPFRFGVLIPWMTGQPFGSCVNHCRRQSPRSRHSSSTRTSAFLSLRSQSSHGLSKRSETPRCSRCCLRPLR